MILSLLFIKYLLIILPILIAVAFLTLVERKVLASMQRRVGPNTVGSFGILQPFADAIKLLTKEFIVPRSSNQYLFISAPLVTFFLSLIIWNVIPLNRNNVLLDLNLGILYLFAISSLNVYGIVIAGWASNSRYAFLGGLRSASQMLSYEIAIGLLLINIVVCTGSLNITQIVNYQENIWFIFPFLPLFFIFLLSALAETSRSPFDLPEAEGELVAGYNVEYSGWGFVLFFLSEYLNIIMTSVVAVLLFFGGWLPLPNLVITVIQVFFFHPVVLFILLKVENFGIIGDLTSFWFALKVVMVLFLVIWIRASFPRYRYDQLMQLGWKVFLPIALTFLIFSAGIMFGLDALPLKY